MFHHGNAEMVQLETDFSRNTLLPFLCKIGERVVKTMSYFPGLHFIC